MYSVQCLMFHRFSEVIEAIGNYLAKNKEKETFVATGVGNHQMMSCQFIRWTKRQPQEGLLTQHVYPNGQMEISQLGIPTLRGCSSVKNFGGEAPVCVPW